MPQIDTKKYRENFDKIKSDGYLGVSFDIPLYYNDFPNPKAWDRSGVDKYQPSPPYPKGKK